MSSEQPAANGHSHQNGKYTRENSAGSEESSSRYSRAFNWTCLLGYSLSFIVFGSQVSILGPTIAPLAEHIGVSEPDLSPLFTALGIACIISGTPSGWLVDRMPTHRVLLGSLLVQVSPVDQWLTERRTLGPAHDTVTASSAARSSVHAHGTEQCGTASLVKQEAADRCDA